MNKPLVSIAMATYNGSKFLTQQMDSLLAQDYSNLEIVISDDCSTDGTWEILQSYANRDNRIRLLPCETNLGYVRNFIRVFNACKGELISPCDQDDIWYPNKTSRLVEFMGDSTLIYCDNRFVDEYNQTLGIKSSDLVPMISGSDSRQLLFCNTVSGHTMLFQRELLDVNEILDMAPYIDWLLAFLAADKGSITYLDEVLVDWRQHSNSTTSFVRSHINGSNAKKIQTDGQALEVFSAISGKHQKFALAAKNKWNRWRNSYFNLSMFIFIIRYGSITHHSHTAKFPALKYLLGYKLKKMLRPNYY